MTNWVSKAGVIWLSKGGVILSGCKAVVRISCIKELDMGRVWGGKLCLNYI